MQYRFYCLFVAALVSYVSHGQKESIKIRIDKDTMRMNEILLYEVSLENVAESIQLPSFSDFFIVGGPNTSSSFSMVNGSVSQSKTYTLYLSPRRSGMLTIDAPRISDKNSALEPNEVHVYVVNESKNEDASTLPIDDASSPKQRSDTQKRRVLKKI
jgi:hypothetical protein